MPQNRIKLSEPVRITNLKDFLGIILNTKNQVLVAEKILNKIPYKDSEWETFCKEQGFSPRLYRKVLQMLKDAKLVQKVNGVFQLSNGFSKQLKKAADYWDDYAESR